jgi:hypothetical protein
MNTILKFNNINIDSISIKKQINISNEFTNYPIKYNNNNLIIQTPIVYLPFGINKYNNKSYIDISFINSSKNDMKHFKTIILNINKYVKKKINRKKLKFISSFKCTENYPERLRLSFYDDILIFSESKQLLSLDYIKSKIYVKLLISPQFIWTNNTSYGIVWNILQMKMYSKPMLDTYSFIDDDINIDKYIKMFKCGVPPQAIKNKMKVDNIDPSLLNTYLPKSELDKAEEKIPFKRLKKKESNNTIVENSGFRMTIDQLQNIKLKKTKSKSNPQFVITVDKLKHIKLKKTKSISNPQFVITVDKLKNIKLKKTKSRDPPKFTHMNPFVNPDVLLKMKNKIFN